MENRFRILSDVEGKRLDTFLAGKLSVTRTKIKEMFEEGHVRIAGRIPKPSLITKIGMEIEGEIPEEKPLVLTPQDIPLDILYEDDFFLAVNKPKGMVVHPSFGHREGTLVNAILSYLGGAGYGSWSTGESVVPAVETDTSRPLSSGFTTQDRVFTARPGIVHRLDKDTTGVILVAKDPKTQELLSDLFKERAVEKTYRTIAEGLPERDDGVVEGNIGRHPANRKKMAVLAKGGRSAMTRFTVIQRLRGYAYIEVYPRTGRTHQIRVHLAHIGHPVVGDETYGKRAKHISDRPLLHAYRIAFVHPVSGLQVTIEAPVPDDIERFIVSYAA
ncbi:MAG: RluA family pseudouridine synthase [Syntrophorhabdus aromaticivorans]|uniref:Pseudouridine synthase n=1 Tax=Syntrophorhabdus aromaticivorans TaxID=328301 RepID=A0A351U232_9BACT|nr:RluA family pseudouridine synthase [Syntrophorhabdus aromaticivorans]HBA54013.1 RluA family pseudouridine synthase [Syntrophorhabdus aromaticivorans]